MRKLVFLFIVFFIFISCSITKLQDSYLDADEDLKIFDRVKSITSYSLFEEKDRDSSKVILIYNGSKLPQKHIHFFKTVTVTTYYTYDGNKLIEKKSDYNKQSSSKMEYDNKGNMINYKKIYQNAVTLEKKMFYDKKNNKVKEIHLNSGKPGDTTLFKYNYKNRTMTLYSPKSNLQVKRYYDQKGEFIRIDSRNGKLLYEYDKMGRVSKKTSYDKNDNLKYQTEFINIYDKKKNLIETKIISDNKLFKTNVYQIEYY